MAQGFSLTRHDGLATYAEALARAGAAVLVYDHRGLGDSDGEPQWISPFGQIDDRRAAVAFARRLDGVDPNRIVVWGYSMGGGGAVAVAATDPRVAAAILVCPHLDGRWRTWQEIPGRTRATLPGSSRNHSKTDFARQPFLLLGGRALDDKNLSIVIQGGHRRLDPGLRPSVHAPFVRMSTVLDYIVDQRRML